MVSSVSVCSATPGGNEGASMVWITKYMVGWRSAASDFHISLSRPSLPVLMPSTCTVRLPLTPWLRSAASASNSPERSRPKPLKLAGGKIASKETRLWPRTGIQRAGSAKAGDAPSGTRRTSHTRAALERMGVDSTAAPHGSIERDGLEGRARAREFD